jgi:predicted nucleotidyltransferase
VTDTKGEEPVEFVLPERITQAVHRLCLLSGVQAIVLGGSRARGTAKPGSDYDLGVYFADTVPLDPAEIKNALLDLVDPGTPCELTAIGEWGPWVVGGGWLSIGGDKVDVLYRNSDAVAASIETCRLGDVVMHYQPGHPHGILSTQWMGEVDICRPLYDPEGIVARLKDRVRPYPEVLRKAIIGKFIWEIGFSIGLAQKAISRDDPSYISGCVFRAFSCLSQVLFAANEQYLINEKGALAQAASFQFTVHQLENRADRIWFAIGEGHFQMALDLLAELDAEVQDLVAAD